MEIASKRREAIHKRMTKTALSWDHVRAFVAAADQGSLSGAARTLNLTQPTLGRQIDRMEKDLGLKLFVRASHGLILTEEGTDLLPEARAMASAAQALERSASGGGDALRGTVRVTASEIIGGAVLPGMLAPLMEAHPGLVIELGLSNQNEDLARRDADIAVRMTRPQQASLVAQRIGTISLGLFAHADYLARRGAPGSVADLKDHTVIGFDRKDAVARSVDADVNAWKALFCLRTDSDLAQWLALSTGVGLGICQKPLAARHGHLDPVLADVISFDLDMWLVMHEDLRRSHRARLVFAHLSKTLQAYAASPPA